MSGRPSTMSNGRNIIVPVVPLVKSQGQTVSKVSSSSGPRKLNPDARAFEPEQFDRIKRLSINASVFVPKSVTLSPPDNNEVSSFGSGTNPEANSFTPVPVCDGPVPSQPPNQDHQALLPIDPRDPFVKQLLEVDSNRNDWVPSVFDRGSDYDNSKEIVAFNDNIVHMAPHGNFEGPTLGDMHGVNMEMQMHMHMPGYGAQAPSFPTHHTSLPVYPGHIHMANYAIPGYAMAPTPMHATAPNPMYAPAPTPVYATAPEFAQQHQIMGKKGKNGGSNKGGKPYQNQCFEPDYDTVLGSHPSYPKKGSNAYGFATPRNHNSYGTPFGDGHGTYARASGAPFQNGNRDGNENGDGSRNGYAGAKNRGPGPKAKKSKQYSGKKDQQNEYRKSNKSQEKRTQFPQQGGRAENRHESRNATESNASMESISIITEPPAPALRRSLPRSSGGPKDTYRKLEPGSNKPKVALNTAAVGPDVVQVDQPVNLTYAAIAKGQSLNTRASATGEAPIHEEDKGAFGDIGAGETQVQMDDVVEGYGNGGVEGKDELKSSEPSFVNPLSPW